MFGFTSFAALSACVAQQWSPGIGDPNVTGWLTVLSYLVCFALALRVSLRNPPGTARRLWLTLVPVLGFLAVNKQLDLQTALTATGRCMAEAEGWYDNRALVQIGFILGLILIVLLVLLLALRSLRGRLQSNGLAMLGATVLCGFVLVRAVGFHHVDSLINMNFAQIKFNFWFENAGLVLIALNALLLLRRGSPRRDVQVRQSRR